RGGAYESEKEARAEPGHERRIAAQLAVGDEELDRQPDRESGERPSDGGDCALQPPIRPLPAPEAGHEADHSPRRQQPAVQSDDAAERVESREQGKPGPERAD